MGGKAKAPKRVAGLNQRLELVPSICQNEALQLLFMMMLTHAPSFMRLVNVWWASSQRTSFVPRAVRADKPPASFVSHYRRHCLLRRIRQAMHVVVLLFN